MGSGQGRRTARVPFGGHKFGLVKGTCRDAGMKVLRLQKHTRPLWLSGRPGAHKGPWGLGQVGVGVGPEASQPVPARHPQSPLSPPGHPSLRFQQLRGWGVVVRCCQKHHFPLSGWRAPGSVVG